MFNGKAKPFVDNARAMSGLGRRDNEKTSVDLLPPVHPGGIFLADKTALGEADSVEFGGIALEPEDVA